MEWAARHELTVAEVVAMHAKALSTWSSMAIRDERQRGRGFGEVLGRCRLSLKAPFPYPGGKSRVAGEAWQAFGRVRNYVEPFFGSGAVLWGNPHPEGMIETICDKDAWVANFWRAVALDPEAVAFWADWPVSEACLTARHRWLMRNRERINRELFDDPDFYDAKMAGWWVWGISQWIGSGWCGKGKDWNQIPCADGKKQGRGVHSQMPRAYAEGGQGVHGSKMPRIGSLYPDVGVHRKRPVAAGDNGGRGVHKRPHLGGSGGGCGIHSTNRRDGLVAWFQALQARLRPVRRIECSDWRRVTGNSVILGAASSTFMTAIFLDPPYPGQDGDEPGRTAGLYSTDDLEVWHQAREWALANGDNPRLRIALCGYEGPEMPGWREHAWKTPGGYGNQGNGRGAANKHRERIWFSPACLDPTELHRQQEAREQAHLFGPMDIT